MIRAAEQKQTALWRARRAEYELVGSELLLEECGAGDAEAAAALANYGVETRHLRAFKVSADREAGLVSQIANPSYPTPIPAQHP